MLRRWLLPLGLLAVLPAFGEELFLWETENEQSKVYLLGSIHMAKPDFYPLPEPIQDAFAESDSLVVEIDLSPEAEAEIGVMALAAGIYGDGRRLSEELSPETLDLFQSYLEERGLPVVMFDSMRPWMAAQAVTIAEMTRLGFDPALGVDRHFMDRARNAGKSIIPLETPEFQINLLSGFNDELQEMFLLYTLKDMSRTSEMIDSLIKAWNSGDTAAMEEIMLPAEAMEDEFAAPVYEKLFFDRNRNMAEKIRGMMAAGGTYFVVVGAGHMVGEEGLVSLLGRDYTVTQAVAAEAAIAQ